MPAGNPDVNAEKTHSAFAVEDQEMARMLEETGENREIIGPPSYSSPDPATLGFKLVPIDQHPGAEMISEDFGGGVETFAEGTASTATEDAELVAPMRDDMGKKLVDGLPENR